MRKPTMVRTRNSRRRWLGLALTGAVVASGITASAMPIAAVAEEAPPAAYQDTSRPFNVRATDLVSRMTLEEKYDQFRAMQPHATWAAKPKAIVRLGVQSYGYWAEANHGIYFPTISGPRNGREINPVICFGPVAIRLHAKANNRFWLRSPRRVGLHGSELVVLLLQRHAGDQVGRTNIEL